MDVLIVIGVIIVLFLCVGTILHSTFFKEKVSQIKPYGEMVKVYDGQMHLYTMGNSEETIILLAGMGNQLPSADFGPLMRKLSEKYKVVCIEYFGVGFSSQTNRARTSENYIEEIRTSLSNIGLKPPYTIMAHSISSAYSEYYASKYPDEVKAIISLDGTSTDFIGEDMPAFVKTLLGVAKLQQAVGFTSLLAPLVVNRKQLCKLGYTEREINDLVLYAGFSINDNTLEQIGNSTQYIKDANKLAYPCNIPYFKVISKQTYEMKNKQINISPQEYQKRHLARIGEKVKYEILEGTHLIYVNNVDRISEITFDLLSHIGK